MGFFSGLVTGAAEGATKSLQSEIDKRDAGLSRARVYAETRFRQQELKADDHDDKVEKAVDRFMTMFTSAGDTKAIAAKKVQGLWTGLGGTLDTAEAYIEELDLSKIANAPVNINEDIQFKGIDLGVDYTDVTRQSILDREAFDRKDFKVNYTDKGLLGRMFGKTDYTEKLGSEYTNPVKPADLPDVTGLTADVDYSNTATARAAARSRVPSSFDSAALINFEEQKKLDTSTPEGQEAWNKLEQKKRDIIKLNTDMNPRGTSPTGPSNTFLTNLFSDGNKKMLESLYYNKDGGQLTIQVMRPDPNVAGEEKLIPIYADEAQNVIDTMERQRQIDFVKNILVNPVTGTFHNPEASMQTAYSNIPPDVVQEALEQVAAARRGTP
jgi:hypothetical protein